jgi:hypothetical protein
MPRNKGSKDKKKRKSRGILVKSGLLGVPTGLGLLGGKGASNYWSNTKGIELYGVKTLTPKLLREFYDNKELTKEYRKDLAKQIRNLPKPQLQKLDSEINLLADQELPKMNYLENIEERLKDPAKQKAFDKKMAELKETYAQRDFYRTMRREVRNNNRDVINSYKKAKRTVIGDYHTSLHKVAVKYADEKRDRLYNTAYSKVKRTNLIKGGLIGLGVGSALLGANELVNRNKRNKGK